MRPEALKLQQVADGLHLLKEQRLGTHWLAGLISALELDPWQLQCPAAANLAAAATRLHSNDCEAGILAK